MKPIGLYSVTCLIPLVFPAVQATQSPPPTPLSGLGGNVTVTRDVQGIAHIRANNEPDLWFMQGWMHASDRLFQMDYNRRLAEGTLAELVGAPAIPTDVQLRTLGLDRAAQLMVDVSSAQTQAALASYAEGVNAWVAANALPLEYGVLELTSFKPWEPRDTGAVSALMIFSLSFGFGDVDRTVTLLTYVQTGLALGFDGQALFFEDLHRAAPFDPVSTLPHVPDQGGDSTAQRALPKIDLALARSYQEQIAAVPFLRRLRGGQRVMGSNEWAISGEHTTSGRPMLANDPHLGLATPATWYPSHQKAGVVDVTGYTLAGSPFVIHGHNRDIAWGSTTSYIDVDDWYQEQVVPDPLSPSGLSTVYQGALEPILPIPESYAANQPGNGVPDDLIPVPSGGNVPPFTLIVPRRLNGPIVALDVVNGTAISVQYSLNGSTRVLDAFRGFNRARTLAEFRSALKYFDVGAQNFAYCDVAGNIAYLSGGETPVREDLQAGAIAGFPPSFLRNGTGGNEWLPVRHPIPGQALPCEVLPYDEMPHAVNPPQGWFMNANNDPTGETADNDPYNRLRPGGGIYYQQCSYDSRRASTIHAKIEAKLAQGGKFSVADMQALQSDTSLPEARVFVPHLQQALARAQAAGADPQLAAFAADARVVEAVGRLASWDFTSPTGIAEGYDADDVGGVLSAPSQAEIDASVACTIFYTWLGRAIENTLETTLASVGLPELYSMDPLRHLLDTFPTQHGVGASGLDFFAAPGVVDPADRRDIVLLRSMASALDLLAGPEFEPAFGQSTDLDDYRWGRLHRIVFAHPLGGLLSIPPAAGAFPPPLANQDGIPVDGGFNSIDVAPNSGRLTTPDAFMFAHGPTHRTVYEAGVDRVRAWSALPGGSSGSVSSPLYFNLLPDWLTNESFAMLFTVGDIFRNATSITKYVPAP